MSIFGKPNINKLKEQKNTDGLIKALSYKDYTVRYAAAEALSQLSDSRVIDRLIESIRSDMDGAFDAALVEIGAPAVEPLIAALEDGRNTDIIRVLGRIGDPCAVDALIAALDLKDGYYCSRIVRALGERGEPHAIDPMLAVLELNDYVTNEECINALGHFDDPSVVDALIRVLPENRSKRRELAAKTLVKIDTFEARKALADHMKPSRESGPELLDDQYKKKINNLLYEPKQTERELVAIGRPVVPSLIAATDYYSHWIIRSEELEKAYPESEHFDWQISAYQGALHYTIEILKEIKEARNG